MENWKQTTGMPYEVSDMGNIRHIFNKNNLAGGNSHNYKTDILCGKCYRRHRIIAKTWIPNPENKPFVNHKNGIKWDNRVENLEWVTPRENNLHAHHVLGIKANMPKNGPSGMKEVNQFTKDGIFVQSFPSIIEAFRKTGINRRYIQRSCEGLTSSVRPFIWQYAK